MAMISIQDGVHRYAAARSAQVERDIVSAAGGASNMRAATTVGRAA
jgi:hypothetical protein